MRTTVRATTKPPKLRLRLRVTQWDRLTALKDLGDADAAELLGVHPSTVGRLREHVTEPGPRFIRAALFRFPGLKFEDLFEVVDLDREPTNRESNKEPER